MKPNDEMIDVITEGNEVVSKEWKSVVHEKGLRHRVAAILLKRESDGKYMIPQAAQQKVEAGFYHSSAGHIGAGESYRSGAYRELLEETRLDIPEDQFRLIGSYWLEKEYPTRTEKERFEIFEVQFLS